MTLSVDDAGPSVQTIFVRGIGEAKLKSGSGRTDVRAPERRLGTVVSSAARAVPNSEIDQMLASDACESIDEAYTAAETATALTFSACPPPRQAYDVSPRDQR